MGRGRHTPARRAGRTVGCGLAVALTVAPTSLGAQEGPWRAGGSLRGTLLVGDSESFFAGNLGGGFHVMRKWRPSIGVRLDAAFLSLDETDSRGTTADNVLIGSSVGPDLSMRAGALRLYARPSVGILGNFRGGTSGAGPGGTGWALAASGALGLRVSAGPVIVEIGADVLRSGEIVFARAGSFTGSRSSGTLTAFSMLVGVSLSL